MKWAAYMELFVVLLFLVGWGVLELVGRRLDKLRENEAKRKDTPGP